MRLHAVLHDGQEGLNEASDAGPAADVFNRTVHVVRAETPREEEEEDDEMFSEQIQPVGPLSVCGATNLSQSPERRNH